MEFTFKFFSKFCAVFQLTILFAIFIMLLYSSRLSIKEYGLGFITSKVWNPVVGERETYGALPSIFGTFVSTIIAMVIAVPMSLVIALFLVELAPKALSQIVGYAVELLAAIPSIIYGMWGLFVFAPFIRKYLQPALKSLNDLPYLPEIPLFSGPPMGIGMLTAGIILSLMVLPFITAVMRDVFMMVPQVLKEAVYGLGAVTWEVTSKVTVRYGIQGLIGATFLGLARAIGETMAVTFVIGNVHRISLSLFAPGTSIASTIANEFGEAYTNPLYIQSLMYLGLILFVISFLIQIIAYWWIGRLQRAMGIKE
ncbi:phosphate ABC transporter permease subunit PstC [bacterium]|nr:phosphate ABC transporter permease subunit PstC [bacterium]